MGAITLYALQVALLLVPVYMIYRWTLAGSTFCRFNRMALMSGYVIAFVALPLCALFTPAVIADESVDATIRIMKEEVASLSATPVPAWPAVISAVYIAGVAVAAVLTLRSVYMIRGIIRRGSKREKEGYTLVLTDRHDISPFSWGRYIVLPSDTGKEDFHIVVTHELAHLRHRHWVDLAIAQLVIIFNWFNPASYLMMKELQDVHEYEADGDVIQSGIDARQYQLLLLRNVTGSLFPFLADSLNHSQLKMRLRMMSAARTNPLRKLSLSLLLPALALAIVGLNVPAIASNLAAIGSSAVFSSDYDEVKYEILGQAHSISYLDGGSPVSVSMDMPPGVTPDIYIDRHLATRNALRGIKSEDVVFIMCDNINNRFVVKTKR